MVKIFTLVILLCPSAFSQGFTFEDSSAFTPSIVDSGTFPAGLVNRWVFTNLATSASVADWEDVVGAYHLTQGSGGNQPYCTTTGVLFSASQWLDATNITVNANATSLAFIYSQDGTVDYRAFMSWSTTWLGLHSDGHLLDDGGGSVDGTIADNTMQDWVIACGSGASSASYQNGSATTTTWDLTSALIDDVGGNAIAHYAVGVTIMEIQIYNVKLSGSDATKIHNYRMSAYP